MHAPCANIRALIGLLPSVSIDLTLLTPILQKQMTSTLTTRGVWFVCSMTRQTRNIALTYQSSTQLSMQLENLLRILPPNTDKLLLL